MQRRTCLILLVLAHISGFPGYSSPLSMVGPEQGNAGPGTQYYVSTTGRDENPGTLEKPFRTIQKAVNALSAGDICFIREGTYQEFIHISVSGTPDRPVRIEAYPDETVVIDGTIPLAGNWRLFREDVFVTGCDMAVNQLFDGQDLLTAARWPNGAFADRWDRKVWARSEPGSKKDLLIAEALQNHEIDWTGASVVLNVGQQFQTRIRKVTSFDPATGTLVYALGERPPNGVEEGPSWADDYFFLFGKLEALDTGGEWFYDEGKKQLYFKPVAGHPDAHDLRVMIKDAGVRSAGTAHVQLRGLHFFACNLVVQNVNDWQMEDCHFRYPVLNEQESPGQAQFVSISGTNNTVTRSSLAYSRFGGFKLSGNGNRLEDCIVRDVNWLGDIAYAGIVTESSGEGNRVQNCTVNQVGNIGIRYRGPKIFIIGNHVFDTGKMCLDISAIHTGSVHTVGSVCAYNWVHHSSGMGIRGDDQTRGLTVHHNVVWNTGFQGVIVKGDFNKVYNNTIFHLTKAGSLVLPTRAEPKKWWTPEPQLEVQNSHSFFHDNIADIIAWRNEKKLPEGFTNNVFLLETTQAGLRQATPEVFVRDLLTDPHHWDFRLASKGDSGAYPHGEPYWIPGATWAAPDLPVGHPLGTHSKWSR